MPIDILSQVQLVALRRLELIQGARQRSQHIHAALATARGGQDAPRALRARALLESHERVVIGLDTRRQELEREPEAVEAGGLGASGQQLEASGQKLEESGP